MFMCLIDLFYIHHFYKLCLPFKEETL